ncbi:MAG: (d)CMP kinase [Fidelibacterota bacterium]
MVDSSRDRFIVAIDGPAASGKSTTAKLVSEKLNYLYIDTGAMYRAITYKILKNNITFDDVEKIIDAARDARIELKKVNSVIKTFLDGEDVSEIIRMPRVSKHVGLISEIPQVRQILVEKQRKMGEAGGVVLEGRDIGTNVFPDADFKFFLDADINERARRRYKELCKSGIKLSINRVKNEIIERDRRDRMRKHSPLKRAEDAIFIDTTNLTIDQQVGLIVNKINEYIKKEKKEVKFDAN